MPREFLLPDLGEGISEAQVVRVLVKPGEQIKEDQYLMEVETDKAAVEIPSPYAGVAEKIHVSEGETINVGSVIVTFDDGGASAGGEKSKSRGEVAAKKAEAGGSGGGHGGNGGVATAEAPAPSTRESSSPSAKRTTAPAAPAVRKLARERGIDLDAVQGSGPGGRITREDLERHADGGDGASTAPTAPARRSDEAPAMPTRVSTPPAGLPDGKDEQDKWGDVRVVPLNQIRKTIATQMAKSVYTIPHVTHTDEADITELERVRRELNEATGDNPKITLMPFIIRALCIALRKFPILNSSFDESAGTITYKKYVNMGIAVDTERGLIVPVIRNADTKGLAGLAAELRSIAERVRTNQFAIEDLRGGTFTITNVGALGGLFSTPIINHPEVAILGLGRSRSTPVIQDDEIAEALMLPLSLSFDHRATDGANAARFTSEVIGFLQNPGKFLLY